MRMIVLATVFVIGAAVGWLLLRRRAMPYAPGFVQRNAEPKPKTWLDVVKGQQWYVSTWS